MHLGRQKIGPTPWAPVLLCDTSMKLPASDFGWTNPGQWDEATVDNNNKKESELFLNTAYSLSNTFSNLILKENISF